MTISNMDLRIGVMAQPGADVATTGTIQMLDYSAGSFSVTPERERVTSNTLKPGRAGAGERQGAERVSGSFTIRLHKSVGVEMVFASLLGGDFVDDVLTAAGAKKAFSLFVFVTDDAGTASRDVYSGCQVTSATLSAENSTGLEVVVNFMAMREASRGVTTALPGTLTVIQAPTTLELIGNDVTAVIGGVTIDTYQTIELSISQEREAISVLNSMYPATLAASAPRAITGSVSYLRKAGAPPAFTGDAQSLSLQFLDIYTFDFGAVYFAKPVTSFSGSVATDSAGFTVGYDTTAGSDLKLSR